MNKTIIKFVYEFHVTRDFYECHEILEEAWIEDSSDLNKLHPYVVLLQIAVSLYHWRRGNYSGGLSLIEGSIIKNENLENEMEILGFEYLSLMNLQKEIRNKIFNYGKYEDFNLPMNEKLVKLFCEHYNLTEDKMFLTSDFNNSMIINKHIKSRNS